MVGQEFFYQIFFLFEMEISVETLQHPQSSSCEHYLGRRRNLWSLPSWAQDLPMRTFTSLGIGIEQSDY